MTIVRPYFSVSDSWEFVGQQTMVLFRKGANLYRCREAYLQSCWALKFSTHCQGDEDGWLEILHGGGGGGGVMYKYKVNGLLFHMFQGRVSRDLSRFSRVTKSRNRHAEFEGLVVSYYISTEQIAWQECSNCVVTFNSEKIRNSKNVFLKWLVKLSGL
jgi:hypothetical protein